MVSATGEWKRSLPTWAAQLWMDLQKDTVGTWPSEEPLGPYWQGQVIQHLEAFIAALEWDDPQAFLGQMVWAAQVARNRGLSESPLLRLLRAMDMGLATHVPADVMPAARQLLQRALNALQVPPEPGRALVSTGQRLAPLPQVNDYQWSLVQGNKGLAQGYVKEAMDGGVSLTEAGVRIIQPAMYAIGELWERNRISVAQEHLASTISQAVLMDAYLQAEFAPPNGRKALLACVQGNHHALGPRMVSDALETAGWDCQYLGADVPMEDLVRHVGVNRPDMLGLSVSMFHHLEAARATIEALRAELGNACPQVWIGGLATVGHDKAWRIARADGWSSDALDMLERM